MKPVLCHLWSILCKLLNYFYDVLHIPHNRIWSCRKHSVSNEAHLSITLKWLHHGVLTYGTLCMKSSYLLILETVSSVRASGHRDGCVHEQSWPGPSSVTAEWQNRWLEDVIDVGVTVHVYIWKPIPTTQYIFQMLILSKNVEIKTEKKSRLWDYKVLSAQYIVLRYSAFTFSHPRFSHLNSSFITH